MPRYGQVLSEVANKVNGDTAKLREFYTESVAAGKINREEVSLRELAQSFMGDGWAETLKSYATNGQHFMESGAAIGASGFAVISGQLMVDQVLEGYNLASRTVDDLVSTDPITNGNLSTQIVPGLGNVVIPKKNQQEMEAPPYVQANGRYVTMPAPVKSGAVAALTMEMLFSDKTRQANNMANSVGEMLGLQRAEEIYRVVYGIVNSYREGFTQAATGTAYNTYLTAGAYWTNKLTDFTLTDWTSIDTLEQLFANMVDPFTGKRIQVNPTHLLVPRKLLYTAKRIFSATETRTGDITTGAGNQMLAKSPLEKDYKVVYDNNATAILKSEGAAAGVFTDAPEADSVVILGDFKKAFTWRYVPEIGPGVKVMDLPLSGEKMSRNIALEVFAQYFGVPAVQDPRYVVQALNAAL